MFFSFFLLLLGTLRTVGKAGWMEALLSWEWRYMGTFKVVYELRFLLLRPVHSVLNEVYDHNKSS